ncbi:hypothetical protein CMO93_06250 [Candidatus Woesearchaeota archaeon]|nr:hypothetical protein [Candidatus Woesearchaeota archaeon]|tara:strand:+ start:840 stop:1871 length:1032 start_codon:yes stop_codon:yes gene_type:complete
MQKQTIKCIFCSSHNIIKKGVRKNKQQKIQKYQCKYCKKYFTIQNIKHKTYPIKIILKAISTYNLGHTLEKTKDIINKRYNLAITAPTILTWINQYKEICTYNKLRKKAIKLYSPKNTIFKKPLQHKQVYLFKYHKAKLNLLQELNPAIPSHTIGKLINYFHKIPTDKFPHHIFNNAQRKHNEQRSSQLKFSTLKFLKHEKNNYANKLAKLALETAKNNYQKHEAIQNFMLINDTSTVAVEVPVYLTNDDIVYFLSRKFTLPLGNQQTPITGHIDVLQLRNSLFHILDYKPEAQKINPVNQLVLYSLALASKLQIPLKDFKAAWFDENNYCEFFPLHCVYEKR